MLREAGVGRLLDKFINRWVSPPGSRGVTLPPNDGRYKAVSVVPNRASCTAAIAIRHQRFLTNEAPTLPLAMCTWPSSCTCKFEQHEDRRVTDPDSFGTGQLKRSDRNWRAGRRATDSSGKKS
jgi:hypothetical protein